MPTCHEFGIGPCTSICGGTESIANAEVETRYFHPPKSISEQGLLVRCQQWRQPRRNKHLP